MKKILFVSPLPPPNYGSAMSSEMCLDILKGSKDFDVKSVKINYSEKISDMGKLNVKKLKGISETKKKIKFQIKNFLPDIIYFMPATSGLGLVRDYFLVKEIRKNWKGKILFHIRSRITEKAWENPIYRKMYKEMFSEQKAIVLDKRLKKDLHGFIEDKDIHLLPNAIKNEISEKEFKKVVAARRDKKSFNILFLSNMDKSKGWPKLLRACKILKEKGIRFHCNFVGSFPKSKIREGFFSYVKRNKLQKEISYLGKKTGEYKIEILKNSDILVFPTEYKLETFGRVIIEGMMAGLTVIANRIASIPTTIRDKETGFVLRENTPKEISRYLEKLHNNKDLREKMGKKGRERFLKHYEIKDYKDKFIYVLMKAV